MISAGKISKCGYNAAQTRNRSVEKKPEASLKPIRLSDHDTRILVGAAGAAKVVNASTKQLGILTNNSAYVKSSAQKDSGSLIRVPTPLHSSLSRPRYLFAKENMRKIESFAKTLEALNGWGKIRALFESINVFLALNKNIPRVKSRVTGGKPLPQMERNCRKGSPKPAKEQTLIPTLINRLKQGVKKLFSLK